MFKKSKIQAEELLAGENFSEELLSQNAKDADDYEIRVARTIFSFLRSSGGHLTISDKELIKNQIRHSVRKLSMKRKLIRWSVAATLLLAAILTSIGYFRINSSREIVNFAQTLDHVKADNNTRILLQNGEEILIAKTQSQIRYDGKGEHILINSEHKVVQKMDKLKAVYNTVIVPYGKRTQITLSEGTKVWLNSGSKLIFPAVFAGIKREVFIDGEAVFDVTPIKDKTFVVSTKDFDIKVVGTVFNVCAYSDDQYSSTVLEKGKITIIGKGASVLSQEKLGINPGTMAVFDRTQKTIAQQQVNPQKYLSWREGYLMLNSEKLENILKKLGRFYNIEMVITDNQLRNETFSGFLDLKNSPEEVLLIIKETTSLSYSINEKQIFINPK